MIDITKTYRTRCGYAVRIYATDGGGEYPVHGAYFSQGKWHTFAWSIRGETYIGRSSEIDLVEVKPRIKREVWVNVYPEFIDFSPHQTLELAKSYRGKNCIACVKLTIDCEYGEGLEDGN